MIYEQRMKALRDWWERLSQRERTMVGGLGGAFLVCLSLVGGFLITDGLSTLEEKNGAMRQALRDLDTQRDAYVKNKQKMAQLESRLGQTPVQLQGYLEQAGKEVGVEIPESNDLPPVAAGKHFTERAVDIRLRKVTLDQLAKFLRRVETGPNLVAVTLLNVRTRDDKHQEVDVEMTVSTWERTVEKKDKPGKKGDKT